ncbi:MAG: tRNA lysidine(34) synthetase TilS [Burkholderiales bacterium]|nr:tRNA lysidine(34) synthetase TilS [Burkholderiales bacterium]
MLLCAVRRRLIEVPLAGRRLVVALSGGLDSVVLLHQLDRMRNELDFELQAAHIHHGLSANADAWASFCEVLCSRRRIPLSVHRVKVAPAQGGVEAAARAARYGVLRRIDADFVATGHHLDDQAETVLLQLLRGGGPAGIAGMGFRRSLGAGAPDLLRPLLDVPRRHLEAWGRDAGLEWVTDESNTDPRFARNFLRHAVLPVIESRYPAWRAAFGRAAENAGEAAELARMLAVDDLKLVALPDGLSVTALRALPPLRAANAVRHWLACQGCETPPRVRLLEGLRQLLASRVDAVPRMVLGGSDLVRYRDRLALEPKRAAPGWSVCWAGDPQIALPDGRAVQFVKAVGEGLDAAALAAAPVTVRGRRGGERLHAGPGRPRRTLKNLLQENAVPPWERDQIPLLFVGEVLVWVPGIGLDPAFAAKPGAASWRISVRPV